MHLKCIRLPSPDLRGNAVFYRDVLGLPVRQSGEGVVVDVGSSRLEFFEGKASEGSNHLAFTIPANQLTDGTRWLSERTGVIRLDGRDEFPLGDPWASESVYFRGPDGIILELIARQRLKNASSVQFSAASLLCVSEVGLAVPDVARAIQEIGDAFGIRSFAGDTQSFHAMGNHDGLLILVPAGRQWFPTSDAVSSYGQLDVELAGTPRPGSIDSGVGWRLTSGEALKQP